MTTRIAIRVVQEIVRENRENGELEGILNKYRVTALNFLLSAASAKRYVTPRRGTNVKLKNGGK